MNEKNFGRRSALKVTPLSMGAMRFPADMIDSVDVIRYGIDHGMRYIDTSRGYGESELKLGRALRNGYREKVILSSKSSPWNIKIQPCDDGSADALLRRIEESLVRLDVDYLDFYQVWSVFTAEQWKLATRPGGMVDGIRKARERGLVRHIGFTTHQKPAELLQVLDEADWTESMLVTFNLLDQQYLPALRKAHELGIGTIVMNPVGGGRLAQGSPVLRELARSVGADSPAELAIRYILSFDCIDTMLNGVTTVSDVQSSLAAVEKGGFPADAVREIEQFFQQSRGRRTNNCTGCNYCRPCPENINISGIFNLLYEYQELGLKSARASYNADGFVRADRCRKCGACVQRCTQHINIPRDLETAHRVLFTPRDK